MTNSEIISPPGDKIASRFRLAIRLLWIAARLGMAILLMRQGAKFFYQGF